MNRLEQLFQDRQGEILSVYFTAGYPQVDDTIPVLQALQSRGVDMAEIGIPFSDPMADGHVIQQSGCQALAGGMTLHRLFDQLENVRPGITMPLVMMGYLNPIMQYGFENFCRSAARAGIDGVIIPDLPFDDYIENYKPIADRYDLCMVMLITPETEDERVRLIDAHTRGFIYMVSTAATTGAQDSFSHETIDYFERINSMDLRNARLIGFGISNPSTLRAAMDNARGAIVGSSFVKLLQSASSPSEAVDQLLEQLGL